MRRSLVSRLPCDTCVFCDILDVFGDGAAFQAQVDQFSSFPEKTRRFVSVTSASARSTNPTYGYKGHPALTGAWQES